MKKIGMKQITRTSNLNKTKQGIKFDKSVNLMENLNENFISAKYNKSKFVENYKPKVEPELYRWSWSYIGGTGAKIYRFGAKLTFSRWSH